MRILVGCQLRGFRLRARLLPRCGVRGPAAVSLMADSPDRAHAVRPLAPSPSAGAVPCARLLADVTVLQFAVAEMNEAVRRAALYPTRLWQRKTPHVVYDRGFVRLWFPFTGDTRSFVGKTLSKAALAPHLDLVMGSPSARKGIWIAILVPRVIVKELAVPRSPSRTLINRMVAVGGLVLAGVRHE